MLQREDHTTTTARFIPSISVFQPSEPIILGTSLYLLYQTSIIMCQLLGMNCAAPTDFSFSFRGFCQRGGATDIHAHGFGLSIYEGRGVRSFHDTLPAYQSPIANLVQEYPIRSYVSSVQYNLARLGFLRKF
jgi:hypothetical protein